MTTGQITQGGLEVTTDASGGSGRLTQEGLEVTNQGTPIGRVTQEGVEVTDFGTPLGRVTQLGLSVTFLVDPTAPRATIGVQARAVDISILNNPPLRETIAVIARAVGVQVIDLCKERPNPPVTVQQIIPSYLYKEYEDDDDLQGFVAAYNELAQEFLDWLNANILPFYPSMAGLLLDWVAEGLYGLTRPVLPFGVFIPFGTYNSAPYDNLRYDQYVARHPFGKSSGFSAADDDVFQRILTWHFFKGDGKYFTIRWLKRRVQRFLIGANGLQPQCPTLADTYRISVSIDENDVVTIGIVNFIAHFVSGARYNDPTFRYNRLTYDEEHVTSIALPRIAMASTFKAAMDAGALEFPFQYTVVVNI